MTFWRIWIFSLKGLFDVSAGLPHPFLLYFSLFINVPELGTLRTIFGPDAQLRKYCFPNTLQRRCHWTTSGLLKNVKITIIYKLQYINRTFDRKGCMNIAKPCYDHVQMRGKIFSRVLIHVPRSQNEDQAFFFQGHLHYISWKNTDLLLQTPSHFLIRQLYYF